MRTLVTLSVALALPLFLPSLALALGDPAVGQAAPAFSVKGADGKTYSLSKLKGHAVVLEWMNPGCPFSKAQYDAGAAQGLQKKYTAQGVVWLSVDSSAEGRQGYLADDAAAAAFLKKRQAAPTALVRDDQGSLGQLYGAKCTPHVFVIDAQGRLAYKGAADDHATSDADEVKRSKSYVAAALDALLAGQPVAVAQTKPYGCGVKYK
jgi:peroxiredoxin